MPQWFKKLTLLLLIPLTAFTSLVGSLSLVTPAHAGIPVTVLESIPDKTKGILDTIWEIVKTAVLNAVVRLVSYAIRKVAYDSAVWLASGGKGETPFAQVKNFGDYMQNVGDEAFGSAIESLSKDIAGPGFNLCKIPDIKTDLALKVGLRLPGLSGLGGGGALKNGQKRPACSWSEFSKNWFSEDTWKSKFNSTGQSLTQQFNLAIQNPSQSDFGVQLDSMQFIQDTVAAKQIGEQLQRLEGQGYLPKTSLISGQIKTPAGIIKKDFEKNTPGDQQEKDEAQISALLSKGDIQVLPTILSIFLNSLVSTMAKNYQEKGVLPFGICVGDYGGEQCKQGAGGVASYEASGVLGGRRAAQELFSSFLTVTVKPVEQYDLVGQLSSCTDNPGLYNCRMDDDMVTGVRQAEGGAPATIKEALDSKNHWLHGEWQLIPPSRPENSDRSFCQGAYCYSNLQVLRQTRILPLGFEIAAQNSNPDKPWKLADVVKGFNDCKIVNGQVIPDPSKPFCHLIDPNWVLKAPASRCNALVPGPVTLAAGSPDRLEECVDLSTCVSYNADGSCATYGYCAREKNTWNFGAAAQTCDAPFRTCRNFSNARTGQSAHYVYRSIDTGGCTAENVGCAFYSLTQNNSGAWQGPGINNGTGLNNGIFFNGNISESACSAAAAGCSAFQIASSTGQTRYFKKAPDYLGCYDTDPNNFIIDWPKTIVDIEKIPGSPLCANYAGVCAPDEVGCNLYTPASGGGLPIPGKFNPNPTTLGGDVCDAKCVGYNAYREMPSNYSAGEPVAYIVPSSGQACSEADSGCSGFTNLNAVSGGGGEQVDYFSYLRPCVLPALNKAADTAKTFITYEGSDSGFQLKTYKLAAEPGGPGQLAGPAYFYRTLDERANFDKICNESIYTSGAASPDCRQFNDDQGRVYYRLLSRTIPVSESCTQYRLNNTELYNAPLTAQGPVGKEKCLADYRGFWNDSDPGKPVCQICFQNGEFKDGSCFYFGLPGGVITSAGQSGACLAEADSCREYKGNAGNNIKDIIAGDDFENASTTSALAGWGPFPGIALSKESTNRAGHSLSFRGNSEAIRRLPAVSVGRSYELAFWAKGTSANLTVSLRNINQAFTKSFGTVTVGSAWQLYKLGPLEWTDAQNGQAATSTFIAFTAEAGGQLFIDNVRLVEIGSNLYLVKNSLSVNGVCDSHLEDNLPGEALGCSTYTDQNNQPVNLTNFSFLCREGALGCTALLDTQNTLADAGPRLYRVWLPGAGGSMVVLSLSGSELGRCEIPFGQSGCYVNEILGVTPSDIRAAGIFDSQGKLTGQGAQVTASTIYIPADTPSTTPVYLIANKEASCNQIDVGCTLAGKQSNGPLGTAYVTTSLKNDPANYKNALCESEALGCNKYTSGASNFYFKDPAKLCAYQSGPALTAKNGPEALAGWYQKGVGVCSGGGGAGGKRCATDSDCVGGGVCAGLGTSQPCYPTYLENNATYGLWSYGATTSYKGYVGECPENQNLCTEFVDHNDANKPYYYIKNESLTEGDCAGQVSQKAGCALFDQTDNPNKYWLTAATYKNSDAKEGILVDPVPAPAASRDANIIIKVNRDRECGEWLQCNQSHRVFNDNKEKLGKSTNVCDAISRCDRGPTMVDCGAGVQSDYSGKIFTEDRYVSRAVGWAGQDYDGYTILGIYPVEELAQVNATSSIQQPDWRLLRKVICNNNNCPNNVDPATSYLCKNNNVACGANDDKGLCVSGICVAGITGETSNSQKVLADASAPGQICRAYPEKDSPFPDTPRSLLAQSLHNVYRCDEQAVPSIWAPLGMACECDYKKVKYGDAFTKYFNYSHPNIAGDSPLEGDIPKSVAGEAPPGICQGGDSDGNACKGDYECVRLSDPTNKNSAPKIDPNLKTTTVDGACLKKKQEDSRLGWKGFCLEPDKSRTINGEPSQYSCLTWYPVDSLIGAPDINNQHVEAGFENPKDGGRLYCLEGNKSLWPMPAPPDNFSGGPLSYILHRQDLLPPYGAFRFWSGAECNDLKNPPVSWGPPSEAHGNSQMSRCSQPPASDAEINFLQSDIESMTFIVRNGDAEDPKSGMGFTIYPNKLNTNGKPQAVYSAVPLDKAEHGLVGKAVTGQYLGKKNEFIIMFGHKNWLDDNGYFDYPGGVRGNVINGTTLTVGQKPTSNDGIWDHAFSHGQLCPEGPGQFNWHAIRIVFDPNSHRFLGYDMAYCDDSGAAGEINYSIYFTARQWCPLLGDALMDPTDNGANRTIAATNKIWKQGQYAISNLGYNFDSQFSPFGSLGLKTLPPPYEGALISPFFKPNNNACGVPNGIGAQCSFDNIIDDNITGGAPYSCSRGTCFNFESKNKTIQSPASSRALKVGKQSLGEIFPRLKSTYEWVDGEPKNPYAYNLENAPKDDFTETAGIGAPPRIYPLGPCDSSGQCSEDQSKGPGFSVNGKSNPGEEIISRASTLPVTLKFFGFADDNKMPLREIKINWDDGLSVPNPAPGLYRNHRGVIAYSCNTTRGDPNKGFCISQFNVPDKTRACSLDSDCSPTPQCVSNPNLFGYIEGKTCDNNFFQFDNIYYCSKDKAKTPQYRPQAECGKNQDLFPEGCCVFQPKITLKDNWGWCNGTCRGASGCYDWSWKGLTNECSNPEAGKQSQVKIILAPKK